MSKYSRIEMIDFLNERMRPLKWVEWQNVTWEKVEKWCELLGFGSRLTKRAPDAEEAAASQSVFNTETLSTSDGVPQSAPARVA